MAAGASVVTDGSVNIGNTQGTGAATITGASLLNAAGAVRVGNTGTGSLTVAAGSTFGQ